MYISDNQKVSNFFSYFSNDKITENFGPKMIFANELSFESKN